MYLFLSDPTCGASMLQQNKAATESTGALMLTKVAMMQAAIITVSLHSGDIDCTAVLNLSTMSNKFDSQI